MTADVDVTAVFPATQDAISFPIPANTLRNNGDTLRCRFGGWAQSALASAAAVCFPGFGIGGAFWWAAQSIAYPADGANYPWSFDLLITRKTATTYAANGVASSTNNQSPQTFFGRGDFNGAPFSGAFVGAEPDPVTDWSLAQTFTLQNSWNAAGGTWRLKSGYIELVRAP